MRPSIDKIYSWLEASPYGHVFLFQRRGRWKLVQESSLDEAIGWQFRGCGLLWESMTKIGNSQRSAFEQSSEEARSNSVRNLARSLRKQALRKGRN